MTERELPNGCPACGALPCDWVNDPLHSGTLEPSSVAEQKAVDEILSHLERCCGAISHEVCEVEGDDDYSILRHNVSLILRTFLANKEQSGG